MSETSLLRPPNQSKQSDLATLGRCSRRYVPVLVRSLALLFSTFGGFLPDAQSSELSPSQLLAVHEELISTSEGKSYELDAINYFWGDASFMQECAPAISPAPEPLQIFYIISIEGVLTDIVIEPDNDVAECIRSNVVGRQFPKPPTIFVGMINLDFTE